MSSNVVIVHDERLEGCIVAPDKTIFPVNDRVQLSELVGRLKAFCGSGGFRLILACHGRVRMGGLLLCTDNLTLSTVNRLEPLNGLFGQGILIDACEVAATSDGQLLCSRIAQIVDTTVEASNKEQLFLFGPVKGVNYLAKSRWDGKVFTWDACGQFLGKHRGGRQAKQDRIEMPSAR